MDAHGDGEVARPLLLDETPATARAAPWVCAAVAHLALVLALWTFGAAPNPRDITVPPPQALNVTLVERKPPPEPEAASFQPRSTETAPAEPQAGETPPRFDVPVSVAPPSAAPGVADLEVLTAPNGAAVVDALPDPLRQALTATQRCRLGAVVAEADEADCPMTERFAQAEALGLGARTFLDAALAPRVGEGGPPELQLGPVTASISMETFEGLSGPEPVIMIRFRMTLPRPDVDHAAPV